MARKLTYLDALKILGTGDSKTLSIIDAALGGAVLVGAATTASVAPLALLEARPELIKYGRTLLAEIGQRRRGVKGRDRTDLLFSAHVVLVITSFFEAVDARVGPLDLDLNDQLRLAGAPKLGKRDRRLDDYLQPLLNVVPTPTPAKPLTELLGELDSYYAQLAESLLAFVQGLAYWDSLNDTQRDQIAATLQSAIPREAAQRYEEGLRRLCIDCPEVFIWTLLRENTANRKEIESLLRAELANTVTHLDNSLSGMNALLQTLTSSQSPARLPAELIQYNQAQLTRPIAEADIDATPTRFKLPSLERAYINPSGRVSDLSDTPLPADDSWWDRQPECDDLQWFFSGYLTSSPGDAPLLILGRPGSGKSVLTKILAAQLPDMGYPALRVVLRQVPAAASVQDQIEYALREATGRSMQWPDFIRSAGDTMPVVLFDGFDELLQSTQVSQSDYLESIQSFQQREAALNRPVAVLVTSRTVVADRVRYPQGTAIVRLDPFTPEQISRWLEIWNEENREYFNQTRKNHLTIDDLRPYGELSREPLLLLMLALYDAEGPSLRTDMELEQTELYERLLQRFVRREVVKLYSGLNQEQFTQKVEGELLRLSVVALAMFNRGRQYVHAEEVDYDMSILLGDSAEKIVTDRFQERITPGQLVLGRFFFVHESQATLEHSESYSYEFLHSTFGEYLIARLVSHLLPEIASTSKTLVKLRSANPDDSFLHATLSWVALTDREQVVTYLVQLCGQPDLGVREPLIGLLRAANDARLPDQYQQYLPSRRSLVARHAVYAANLLTLILASSGSVTASELWEARDNPIRRWQSQAYLWKACLSYTSWSALIRSITVTQAHTDDSKQDAAVRLGRNVTMEWPRLFEAPVFAKIAAGRDWCRFGDKSDELELEQCFVNGWQWDFLTHATEPLISTFPESLGVVVACEDGQVRSALHLLVKLRLYMGTLDARLYRWAMKCIPRLPADEADRYFDSIYAQFTEDLNLLDQEVADAIVAQMLRLMPGRRDKIRRITRLATLTFA